MNVELLSIPGVGGCERFLESQSAFLGLGGIENGHLAGTLGDAGFAQFLKYVILRLGE